MGPETSTLREPFLLELRRGVLGLAILARLREEEYGYALKRSLQELGVSIDEGTLYPLLRRLESQGLLASRWILVVFYAGLAVNTLFEQLSGELLLAGRWPIVPGRVKHDGCIRE